MPKAISDQIHDLENTRAAKAARMMEIQQKASDEGRSMEDHESEEFDNLDAEIKELDANLVRARRVEALNVQRGTAVDPAPTQAAAAASRGVTGAPAIILNREPDEAFQGQNFTRMVIAKALAYKLQTSQSRIAIQRWGNSNPKLVQLIKANEIQGGGTEAGTDWGAELAAIDGRYTGDFIEYLNAQTVFNQLPLREVPENVLIKSQEGQATAYWTGEMKAVKMTELDFDDVELRSLEVDALAAISLKLLRESNPAAEMLVRDGLVAAIAQTIDLTFLGTAAASAGVYPAGILNGVVAIGTHGSDGDALRADVRSLYAPFIAAKNAMGLTFVCHPALAKGIQLMTNALGQTEFPGINQMGGTLLGDPVVTGENVNASHLMLLKPSDIWKIGDRGITVSMSTEATLEMATDPTGAGDVPTAQSKNPVSMFQSNMVAIKVTRPLSFAKRRASAVAYINDADYGTVSSV